MAEVNTAAGQWLATALLCLVCLAVARFGRRPS